MVSPVPGRAPSFVRRLLDPVSSNWLIVAGASVGRLLLGLVGSVLIARSLGRAEFGLLAAVGTVASVVAVLGDLGFSTAGVKTLAALWAADPTAVRPAASRFFWLRVSATAAVTGLVLVGAGPVARVVAGSSGSRGFLVLALLGVVATAFSGSLSQILQATGHFGRLSVLLLTNSALTAVFAVVLTALGRLDLFAVLVILGMGTTAATFTLGIVLTPAALRPGRARPAEVLAEGRRLIRIGRWICVSDLLAMLAAQLDILLVTRWGGLAQAGLYALALNLASKADVLNHSLQTVVLPAAAALRDEEARRRYVRQSHKRSAVVTAALLLFLPVAGVSIRILYGAAYVEAVPTFQALVGVVIFDLWTGPLLLLALPAERPRLLATADAVRLLTLVPMAIWLVPRLGPSGMVLAKLASKASAAALVIGLLRQTALGPANRSAAPPDEPARGASPTDVRR